MTTKANTITALAWDTKGKKKHRKSYVNQNAALKFAVKESAKPTIRSVELYLGENTNAKNLLATYTAGKQKVDAKPKGRVAAATKAATVTTASVKPKPAKPKPEPVAAKPLGQVTSWTAKAPTGSGDVSIVGTGRTIARVFTGKDGKNTDAQIAIQAIANLPGLLEAASNAGTIGWLDALRKALDKMPSLDEIRSL